MANGRAIVQGTVPSTLSTTWTEIGVVYYTGSGQICVLSSRNSGQATIINQNNFDLVVWGYADVLISTTVPTGIVRYVARRSGSAHHLWINGKYIGSASYQGAPQSQGEWLSLGSQAGSGAEAANGIMGGGNGILSVVRTPLALSDDKCLSLSANPWDAFSDGNEYEDIEAFITAASANVPVQSWNSTSKPMNRQPQGRAVLNRNHPLAKGLIGVFLPGSPVNLVDGVSLASTTGTAPQPTLEPRGGGLAVASGTYKYPRPLNASAPEALLFDRTVLTALVVGTQDSAQNANYALYRANGSTSPAWGVGWFGGSAQNGAYARMGTYFYSVPSTSVKRIGMPFVVALTADGVNARVYLDGAFMGGNTYTAPTYSYSDATRRVQFGASSATNGATNQAIKPNLGLVWDRALSDLEIAAISANPWQLFLADDDYEDMEFFITKASGNSSVKWGMGQRTASRQPQGRVEVNWQHPLAKDLVHLLWLGDTKPRDLVNLDIPFTVNSTITRAPGPNGMSRLSPAVSYDGVSGPRGNFGKAKINFPVTLLSFCNVKQGHTGGPCIIAGVGDGGNGGYCIKNAYGNLYVAIQSSGGVYAREDQTGPIQAGDQILGFSLSSTELAMIRNGRKVESIAVNNPHSLTYDMNYGRVQAFGNPAETTPGAAAREYYQAAWNRVLTPAELQSLQMNPWQLFLCDQDYEDMDALVTPTLVTGSTTTYGTRGMTRQPQCGARIIQSHPLAKGLQSEGTGSNNGGFFSNLVGRPFFEHYGNMAPLLPTKHGLAYVGEGYNNILGPSVPSPGPSTAPSVVSAIFVLLPNYAQAGAGIVSVGNDSDYRIQVGTNGKLYAYMDSYGQNGTSTNFSIVGTTTLQTGVLYVATINRVKGVRFELWLNGKLEGSVPDIGWGTSYNWYSGNVGSPYDGYWGSSNHTYGMWWHYGVSWTPEQIRSFHSNPWQIYESDTDNGDLDLIQQLAAQLRKALYMNGQGYVMERPAGDTAKPLVLINGEIRQRISTEGLPLTLDQGTLRTLASNETLS